MRPLRGIETQADRFNSGLRWRKHSIEQIRAMVIDDLGRIEQYFPTGFKEPKP